MQQWLQERFSVLSYRYNILVCLVNFMPYPSMRSRVLGVLREAACGGLYVRTVHRD